MLTVANTRSWPISNPDVLLCGEGLDGYPVQRPESLKTLACNRPRKLGNSMHALLFVADHPAA